jgi:hypothetical protein
MKGQSMKNSIRPRDLPKMKILLFPVIVGLLSLIILCSGCSPTQQAWTERGREGISIAMENQTSFFNELMAEVDKGFSTNINAAYKDIADCQAGKIIVPSTGKVVVCDAKWLAENQKALIAGLKAWMAKRQEIQKQYNIAMDNLRNVSDCFVKVQDLNKAWATTNSSLESQINLLTQKVSQMQAK